jgi:hypothetical protein
VNTLWRRHSRQLTRNIKIEQYRTGFLPIRSDIFPYKGERVHEARRYALTGEGWKRTKREMPYIPGNPAVIFAPFKFFDDRGQCYCDGSLLESIRRNEGIAACNRNRYYLVESGQSHAGHETRNDDPKTIIRDNMLFCRYPGGTSLWFLLGRQQVPVLDKLRGCRVDMLRGNRHQDSRLGLAKRERSLLNVGPVQQVASQTERAVAWHKTFCFHPGRMAASWTVRSKTIPCTSEFAFESD